MLIEEDLEATRAKLAELHSVHRSLDKMISHLADSPVQDELEVRRLKKQKLLLKDQISVLEKRLVPDVPA
jgi:hypothetical protein